MEIKRTEQYESTDKSAIAEGAVECLESGHTHWVFLVGRAHFKNGNRNPKEDDYFYESSEEENFDEARLIQKIFRVYESRIKEFQNNGENRLELIYSGKIQGVNFIVSAIMEQIAMARREVGDAFKMVDKAREKQAMWDNRLAVIQGHGKMQKKVQQQNFLDGIK